MRKCLAILVAVGFTAAACSKSAPMRPSDGAATGSTASTSAARASVTITAPQPVSPAASAQLGYGQQPLTLTVKNAVSTGSTPLTYSFQVATDSGFANIVYTKDAVAQDPSGQTGLQIARLAGSKDYFWRVKAMSGNSEGPAAPARGFSIGPEIIIQAPALVAPGDGGSMGQGALVVNNAERSGPAGAISYKFEVSTSSSFGSLVFDRTVPEGNGTTAVTMDAQLTTNATYFWRARALDAGNGVEGDYSGVRSFKFVPFDLSQAVMLNSPADLATWPETAKITSIQFDRFFFAVDFDRRDGGNRWPDVVPAGWDGALQYTLGMCVNPSGQWYCSAVVQFWHGRALTDSAPPSHVGFEWFYDPSRWGPIVGYQPQDGELVGIFVVAGNARDAGNVTRASCPRICERSNVALIPWSNFGNESYAYSLGKLLVGGR
jgi:hypothetical protein